MIEENSVRISSTVSNDVAKNLEQYAIESGLKKSSIVHAALKQFLAVNPIKLINGFKIEKIMLLGVLAFDPTKIPYFKVGEVVPNKDFLGTVTGISVSEDGSFFFIYLEGGKEDGQFGPITTFTVSTSQYGVARTD